MNVFMINTFRVPKVGKNWNAFRKDAVKVRLPLGNPAVCVRPVAFRPCLATGLTFLYERYEPIIP
jgi:hypothetical protein